MRRQTSLALVALVLAALPLAAQAGPPRPSPRATVSQVVGITDLSIVYSRPGVKGRAIWGGLVPWDQIWRTGANEATTFTVSSDVLIEGKPLAAGSYALFTIPHRDRWTLVFDKRADQWGAFSHQDADDVLRVDVKAAEAPLQERLELSIPEVTDTMAKVLLRWEKVAVPFTVTVDTPNVALARARTELAATPKPSALASWARWAQESNLATEQALGWSQRALAAEDIAKRYWANAVEARLLARSGKVAEARAAAQRALDLAPTSKEEGVKDDVPKLQREMRSWTGGIHG